MVSKFSDSFDGRILLLWWGAGHEQWVYSCFTGFPGGSDGEESACNAGDAGSIPGVGRSPGEGNGNPLQYSRLGNPMD